MYAKRKGQYRPTDMKKSSIWWILVDNDSHRFDKKIDAERFGHMLAKKRKNQSAVELGHSYGKYGKYSMRKWF